MKKPVKIIFNVIVGILLYLLFSYFLFLGLQVKPIYGTLGVLAAVTLLAGYIYIYKKLVK